MQIYIQEPPKICEEYPLIFGLRSGLQLLHSAIVFLKCHSKIVRDRNFDCMKEIFSSKVVKLCHKTLSSVSDISVKFCR